MCSQNSKEVAVPNLTYADSSSPLLYQYCGGDSYGTDFIQVSEINNSGRFRSKVLPRDCGTGACFRSHSPGLLC